VEEDMEGRQWLLILVGRAREDMSCVKQEKGLPCLTMLIE
jgi:hypothetical protein